ncbi:hypothetical protein [Chitinophaga filiformis]|nr:hypothetical protein [Chitinophaga filiformis]
MDTSFFLRLLKTDDSLSANATGYFKYFLEQGMPMLISTISIAEYCVKGTIEELPMRHLQIVPFNIQHAKKAGEFAKVIFENKGILSLPDRKIIPNDTKLFAQADAESAIVYYLTSDVESIKIFKLLKEKDMPKFQLINLYDKHNSVFGLLDF